MTQDIQKTATDAMEQLTAAADTLAGQIDGKLGTAATHVCRAREAVASWQGHHPPAIANEPVESSPAASGLSLGGPAAGADVPTGQTQVD